MTSIKSIRAIQVLDSRGLPTISCMVSLDCGIKASAMVPSGASTGTKEALELRDGDELYMGKGVDKAVANINNIIIMILYNFIFQKTKIHLCHLRPFHF